MYVTPLSVSYCGHRSDDTQQVQVQSWPHVRELKEDTVGFSESSVPSVSSICITRSIFHSSLPCPVEPWTTLMGSLTLLTSTYFWSMGNPWRWLEGKEENEVRVLPLLAPFVQGFPNPVSSPYLDHHVCFQESFSHRALSFSRFQEGRPPPPYLTQG